MRHLVLMHEGAPMAVDTFAGPLRKIILDHPADDVDLWAVWEVPPVGSMQPARDITEQFAKTWAHRMRVRRRRRAQRVSIDDPRLCAASRPRRVGPHLAAPARGERCDLHAGGPGQREGRGMSDNDEIVALKRELQIAINRADALQLEAEQWKGEAIAHKTSLHEAYQVLTGATGEPAKWNGARPFKQFQQVDRAVFLTWVRQWAKHRFGKWITHDTARGAFNDFAEERSRILRETLAATSITAKNAKT